MISDYNSCKDCEDNCCKKPYVAVPLTEKEARLIKELEFNVSSHEYPNFSGGYYGCDALDKKNSCIIYNERPSACQLFPISLAAFTVPGMYGDLVYKFSWVVKDCSLGKKLSLEECVEIVDSLEPEFAELMRKHADLRNRWPLGAELDVRIIKDYGF